MEWRAHFEAELENAAEARRRGKEGQARVCARRAAGIAAREYLSRHGIAPAGASAVDLLQQLKEHAPLAPDLRSIIDHLTQRVDHDFRLPPGVDLLAETRRMCEMLLQD